LNLSYGKIQFRVGKFKSFNQKHKLLIKILMRIGFSLEVLRWLFWENWVLTSRGSWECHIDFRSRGWLVWRPIFPSKLECKGKSASLPENYYIKINLVLSNSQRKNLDNMSRWVIKLSSKIRRIDVGLNDFQFLCVCLWEFFFIYHFLRIQAEEWKKISRFEWSFLKPAQELILWRY